MDSKPENIKGNPDLLFTRVYRSYMPRLTAYACRFVDDTTATDILHDLFLKIWSRRQFDLPDKEMAAFLYRSVGNACRDHIKHLKVADKYTANTLWELKLREIDFHYDNIPAWSDDERMAADIHRAIEKLPVKCREIFTESYLNQKKSSEIASAMGISQRTVESQLYKGLRLVRGIFKDK